MSVQAIIEFVGIIVIATAPPRAAQVKPASPGVIAIIPRVNLQGVPTHTAAIIYPTAAGQPGLNWVGKSVPIQPGGAWSYLPLDGDQLSFITGLAPTQPPTRPTTLDALKGDWEAYNSGVKKLALDPGFTTTNQYAKAAAVVRLTDGTVSGCHSLNHPGRTETTATIDTNGSLTIISNRVQNGSLSRWATLKLDLTQNATFAIVNLPTVDVTGAPQSAMGNHYLAYCAMANQSINCPIPVANPPDACPALDIPLPEFANAPPMAMTSSATAKQPIYRVVKGPGGKRTVLPTGKVMTHAMSADCSNTTWP